MIYYLKKDDLEQYERTAIELKCFYIDSKTVLPISEKYYTTIGLYLLFLIYKNRNADYCTELEYLTIQEQKNIFISAAVSLEQHFIDGNYFKILYAKQNVPIKIYNYFIEKMVEAVRREAARSAEKAYRGIRITDAYRLFLLNNLEELLVFVEEEKEQGLKNNIAWVMKDNYIYFEPIKKEVVEIPSKFGISASIEFAHELTKIV